MVSMISSALKPAVTRMINPVARIALRAGLTPNSVTLIGALGLIASAAFFYSNERYFIGTLAITLFSLSDLFDGAMARISEKGASAWGGFLDSTIDRVTDSAIIITLALPLIRNEDSLAIPALIALVTGILIPYIRAKAESFSIPCSVGITERTERLVIVLVAAGFHGLGVPYILAVGIWLLAILGAITVLQRLLVVRNGLRNL
jgi:CDP-diacylglycerol--glycerol-3-phosphate 3-phosphatidyltransferase